MSASSKKWEAKRVLCCFQEDLASQTDVVGSADQAPVGVMGFFQRAATGGQDRADAFALNDRGSILHHLDQPAIIPHVAESENKKFTFEVVCAWPVHCCEHAKENRHADNLCACLPEVSTYLIAATHPTWSGLSSKLCGKAVID